ncbi:MAG: LysR family transcriptional regulator [Rhodobacterales bacterium]
MALRFTIRQLEYLVAVGDAGSIAEAAARINLSSPSISAAISQLEAEFGVQLFVRKHAKGLSLTPGGQRIYNKARHILDSAASLHDLAGEIAHKPRGPLNVGCFVPLAPLISAALRRSFTDQYPDASVTLCEAHHSDLLRKLRRAEIDVAITYDLEIPKDVGFEVMAELPPFVMVSANHPLAGRGAVHLHELQDDGFILLDLPMSRDYFLAMFYNVGLRPKVTDRTSDTAVVRSLVANGMGYSLINARRRTDIAPDGQKLAYLRLLGDHAPINIGLATMQADHKSRILKAFEAHARAHIATGRVIGMSGG